jgi:hypothetical protein
MKLLFLALCLALVPSAAASSVDSSLDTNKDGKVDAAETTAAVSADAAPTDVIADGAGVISAIKGLKNRGQADSPPVGLLVAVLLGAVFKLLLSLIKVLGKNLAWFKTQDGKRVVKYSTIGLGSAAALLANLAFGLNWVEALTILLSGPLAVAIHEYTSDSKPVEEKSDAKAT